MVTKPTGNPETAEETPAKPRRAPRSTARAPGKPPAETAPRDDLYVVGIGASAGGLEALRPFVGHLPASSRMAFVIVQHLSPQYRSMLVQLLGRETALPVAEIKDGTVVAADTIYITPPNKDVQIRNSTLWLREPAAPMGPKPSVDVFFVSLAEDKGPNAIGVILSGTGTDGAHGIRALKVGSGLTIAQVPDTAKYDGMPKAAIETGCVDLQLSPEQMGPELAAFAQFPRPVVKRSTETAGPDTVDEIFRLVRKKTDIDFSQYKPATIQRRLERRLAANRIETVEAYLDFVKRNPAELELLCKDILISVTSFFRDNKAFEDLRETIGEIVRAKKTGDPIRIWVPGCATGEEAYSIAMLLEEQLGRNLGAYNVQIFATDIDFDAMALARKGTYPETILENLKGGYVTRYFDQLGQSYQVKKQLREMVVFARQDLAKDPPFVRVDLISCRNVMIYFNVELQARVFSVFHYALKPDGYLFLGKSESIGHHADLFRPAKSTSKIFKKRVGQSDKSGTPLFGQFRPRIAFPMEGGKEASKPSYLDLMRDAFIEAYAPPSVVVNDNLDVLHFHDKAETFINLPRGKPELNLAKLIIADFRTDVRVLLHRSARDNGAAVGTRKRLTIGGEVVAARLVVRPLSFDVLQESLFLVSCEIEKLGIRGDAPDRSMQEKDADERIAELEQELVATKENLQTVVEELETSNEELQALNEEMQAANEELQSSNEELETSNEELQSTNEELTTVNEELQVRTAELGEANVDLENIQNNVGFPLIVLDRNLRITRFTPPAVRLFGLLPSDVGQILTSVPSYADMKELRERLINVIRTGTAEQDEIETHDAIYRMRIVPYRDREERTNGAILTFIDETDLRAAQKKLRESADWIQFVTDSVPVLIAYVDGGERYRFCNRPFCERYGKTRDEVIGARVRDVLGVAEYDVDRARVRKALKGEDQVFERELDLPGRGRRFTQLHYAPRVGEDGKVDGFFLLMTDIDDLKKVQAELWRAKEMAEQASRAKSDFLANMSHELRTPLNAIIGFSQLIEGKEWDPDNVWKCRAYSKDIRESGQLLLSLINDILDLSKVEAGKFELEESEINPHRLCEAAFKLVRERAEGRKVGLVNDLVADGHWLYADEIAVKRILLNLLTNAIKFTEPDGEVRVAARAGADGYVFTVADTGIGIAAEDLAQVMAPFEQGGVSAENRKEGVGLGLSITHSLVAMHGGHLAIDSAPGRGTTVTVRFPPHRICPIV